MKPIFSNKSFIFLLFGFIFVFVSMVLLMLHIMSNEVFMIGVLVGFSIVGLAIYLVIRIPVPVVFSYEGWKKTATEMGLHDPDNPVWVEGDYRNHHVEIYLKESINVEGGIYRWTNCDVKFENPRMIKMNVRKKRSFSGRIVSPYIRDKSTRCFEVGDPIFDSNFFLIGNKENEIKAIMDSAIRSKIMNINKYLEEMGYNEINLIEIGYIYVDSGDRPSDVGFLDTQELRPNIVRITGLSFEKLKGNASRFRLIVDAMIDIVEKIESYTPSF